MNLPNWLPKNNPQKLLYQIPLAIIVVTLLLHFTAQPDNLFVKRANQVVNIALNAYESFLTNHNFLDNPSFENQPGKNGQISGWNYFGWQIDPTKAALGQNSVITTDLVNNPFHSLKQDITFFFPAGGQILYRFSDSLPRLSQATRVVTLTTFHFDLTKQSQVWKETLNGPSPWQNRHHLFQIPKSAYRLNLETVYLSKEPIFFDNASLNVLTRL